MKLEVNISKGNVFVLLGLVLVLTSVFVIYAAVNEAAPWHDASQVKFSGVDDSLQELLDNGGLIVACDWSGLDSAVPGKSSGFCENGYLKSINRNLWNAEQCTTSHAKGYTCVLDANSDGSYDLDCSSNRDTDNEWMGTLTNQITDVYKERIADATPYAKVEYNDVTGAWKLTSQGKNSDHSSPTWTTLTCTAGGLA